VTTTVDEKQRVVLSTAKPGEKFDVQASGDGGYVLRKLAPQPEPRRVVGKLVKRGDALILEAEGWTVDEESIAAAVREERDSR
jgi:hypothetical protein